jgi:hypothetical protein
MNPHRLDRRIASSPHNFSAAPPLFFEDDRAKQEVRHGTLADGSGLHSAIDRAGRLDARRDPQIAQSRTQRGSSGTDRGDLSPNHRIGIRSYEAIIAGNNSAIA